MNCNFLGQIYIKNIFLYITEKCNLNCEYCYFKYKKGNHSLDFQTITTFLESIKDHPYKDNIRFIISGGEPTLSWELLREIIYYIRNNFGNNRVNIQTNGISLDYKKIIFLKKYHVGIEFGIDGNFSSSKYRKGLTYEKFDSLCKNIQTAKELNLSTSATMTVHPDEANNLVTSLSYLVQLGIKNIDITPAAFMDWNKNSIKKFKNKYSYIVKKLSEAKKKILSIGEDLPFPFKSWDLSLGSGGYVLPGDVYLCLPQQKKKEFSILSIKNEALQWKNNNFNFYIREYEKFLKSCCNDYFCHRDFIIASFSIINEIMKTKNYKVGTKHTIELLTFLKNANRVLIKA